MSRQPSLSILESLFGSKARAFQSVVDMHIADNRDKFFANEGHCFALLATNDAAAQAEVSFEPTANTRLSVYYVDGKLQDFATEGVRVLLKPTLRVDIPTHFLKESHKPKYWLYNIRFAIDYGVFPVDDKSVLPLRRGYYGVTKRGVFERFKEHKRDAESGGGHMLHKAWRGLHEAGFSFYPVIQVSSFANTLDEIYEVEEAAVAKLSLAPLGLNVIPGGYAGIKMLHSLSLLDRKTQVKPSDRDAALVALERSAGTKKCTHYRSGHFRTLFTGTRVWVSPCWVNATRTEAA
ncbi:hypothetical protein [Rhizobium phage RHph_X2_30]|nr:hypothetical protein [Rhizobium phage RHph_X2_30]